MEVPPGRVERIADGGPEVIRSILAELRAMKFNGVLKTSVFRGDTPSQGVLVLRRGDGVLAEHRSEVDVAGHDALPEILEDAASARAQLEVRTYDYGHSSISIDHLQRSYPEAAVEGIGDPEEGPRDGGREGQIGARGPATQPVGAAGETRRTGARIRVEGSHVPGPRNVARFTSRIPRTGAEADERPLREPSGRGREDLRGPEGVRGPAPGGGTTRTAPHRPRDGHPGPRDEAPRPWGLRREARTGHGGTRKIAPAKGGRARDARDGALHESLEDESASRQVASIGAGRPAAAPDDRDGRT